MAAEEAIAPSVYRLAHALETLPPPRSLCEVGLDQDDFNWLLAWASALKRPAAITWLNQRDHVPQPLGAANRIPMTRSEALGCLLLLVAAESGRREAKEGHLWSVVSTKYQNDTRRELFSQGQPTPWHKAALEAAAVRFRLRHVFGIEGTQNYYITVYLQFGFTRSGLRNIPHWLAGFNVSEAASLLLGPRLGSTTFQALWAALRDYRRERRGAEEVRRLIARSPWVMVGDEEELLKRARERAELGTASDQSVGQELGQSDAFLERPHLDWTHDAPQFVLRIADVSRLSLTASRYDIVNGADVVASLLRQPDGSYHHEPTITLPADHPRRVLILQDETAEVAITQAVDVWDPEEEVNLFDASTGIGVPDPWGTPLSRDRAYVLLTPQDLRVDPPPARWRQTAQGTRRFWDLPRGWPADLKVILDGEELWSPNVGASGRSRSDPLWTSHVRMQWRGGDTPGRLAFGESIRPVVAGLTPDIELITVRQGTVPCAFTTEGLNALLEPIGVGPELSNGLSYILGLRCGEEHARVRRRLELPIHGITRLGPEGWEAISASAGVTTDEARTRAFRILLPPAGDGLALEPVLFEGDTFSRRLHGNARALGVLGGYGAPLRVLPRPYNTREELVTIADRVTAPGIIQAVEQDPAGLRIHLSHPLEPAPQHRVLLWPAGRGPAGISVEQVRAASPNKWVLPNVPIDPMKTILGIGYDGHRLGAWWPRDLAVNWQVPDDDHCPPLRTAALIRWFRLPVLDAGSSHMFQAFARHHPDAALAAWVLDRGIPKGLYFEHAGEEWLATLRTVFWGWRPTVDQANAVIAALWDGVGPDPVREVAAALRHDPLLLARLLGAWCGGLGASADRADARARVRELRRAVAGLPPTAREDELSRQQVEMLARAGEIMEVDRNFLQRGVVEPALRNSSGGGRLAEIQDKNLRTALAVAPFRDYLALCVLGPIAEGR